MTDLTVTVDRHDVANAFRFALAQDPTVSITPYGRISIAGHEIEAEKITRAFVQWFADREVK